ncbi:pyridoxal phosphate-dependent transferase [Peziza echinospora]|nr:pyridoxal phosphate-dependent transferase [Peziza echinospora]
MDIPPKDLSHHLSPMARRRQPSVIKSMYKYFLLPGMQNLAAGMPSADLFPFNTLEAEVQDAPAPSKGDGGESTVAPSTSRLLVPKYPRDDSHQPPTLLPTTPSLSTALQYGTADGYPPLTTFLSNLVLTHIHHPFPLYTSPAPLLLPTCGTTDGLNKVFEMLLTPGDSLLCEEYTYLPAPSAARAVGARVFGVEMDEFGVRSDALEYMLSTWNEGERGGARKPRVLYTITVGQNPTGRVVPGWRRREVYRVCEGHDVVIVEDDPYWNLQYEVCEDVEEEEEEEEEEEDKDQHAPQQHQKKKKSFPFLHSLTQSYLTHDPSGRVIHLSTFSKTICPGARLGWIVAQPLFINRLLLATEAGTQQPSGFTQALVADLLVNKWGAEGFVGWMEYLRDVYKGKMEVMVEVLRGDDEEEEEEEEEEVEGFICVREMYTFTPPPAGMFIWVKILYQNHPLYHYFPSTLPERLWDYLAMKHLVLVTPGSLFPTTGGDNMGYEGDPHFRLSFSVFETHEEVRRVTRAFVRGVTAFWGISREELEGIGEEGVSTSPEEEGGDGDGDDDFEVGGREWRAIFGC